MKLQVLPVLIFSVAASAQLAARPMSGASDNDAEVGPRFSVPQTQPRQSQPQQSQPQQVPRVAPNAPQAPGNSGNARNNGNGNNNQNRQSRNQTPSWQVYRDRDDDRNDNDRGNSNWNRNQRDDDQRDNNSQWSTNRSRNSFQRNQYDGFRSRYYNFNNGRYYARQRFSLGFYWLPRGYSTRAWYVGNFLPFAYYDDMRYHINTPWSYNLYDAPIGCHWIRVGSDAILIDYFSGEILEVVYSLFW